MVHSDVQILFIINGRILTSYFNIFLSNIRSKFRPNIRFPLPDVGFVISKPDYGETAELLKKTWCFFACSQGNADSSLVQLTMKKCFVKLFSSPKVESSYGRDFVPAKGNCNKSNKT